MPTHVARHGLGLVRGVAFTILFLGFILWTLVMAWAAVVPLPPWEAGLLSLGSVVSLAFLASLPGFCWLCTTRVAGGTFFAPSVLVVMLFLSFGLAAGAILALALSLLTMPNVTAQDAFTSLGVLAPILSVALSMVLAGVTRSRGVWETDPHRLTTAKHWMYLAPPSLFLVCQAVSGVAG